MSYLLLDKSNWLKIVISPELRQLATQLREAYVGKIRLAQIDEKEKLKQKIVVINIFIYH